MAKVKDTLKRNIKFENVKLECLPGFDSKTLVDENGDVLAQIQEKLPDGATDFTLSIDVAIPQVVVNRDGEVLSGNE